MANEQSQNRGGRIKSIRSHMQKVEVLQMHKCAHKGGCGKKKKLVVRYARTNWMPSDKSHGTFFVHWSGQLP